MQHPTIRSRRGRRAVQRILALTLFPAAFAACDRSVTDATDPRLAAQSRAAVAAQASAEAEAQHLARGIAAALAKPQLRAELRNEMRDSRWNEHKLVLQSFAHTRGGEAIVAAAAEALGTTPDALQQTIATLPEIDFYVPFSAHRRSWRGSPDVLVAATFDGDAPAIQAYATDGSAKTLRLADGTPAQPLVLLQPAEPKAIVNPASTGGGGNTIEPTCIEPVSTGGTTTLQSGSTILVIEPPCDGGGGGGGGGGTPPPPPSPGVYITHFNIQEGDGWFGSLEVQFHSQAVSGIYPPHSAFNPYDVWIFDQACSKGTFAPSFSPNEDQGYDGLWMLSPGITNVNSVSCSAPGQYYYAVNIVEIDGGLNGDNDDFGYRFFGLDGATVGTVLEFRRVEDNARTAWVKFEYR